MYYSAIGLIAIMILIIENKDILRKRSTVFESRAWQVYRKFLFAVLFYYVTDVLWGVPESIKSAPLLFADTTVYFIAMAIGVLFWTQYTVIYLDDDNSAFGRFLMYAGRIFLVAVTILAGVNVFVPVIFTVDENCVYHTCGVRNMILIVQILLLITISVNAFSAVMGQRISRGRKNSTARSLFSG